MSGIATPAQPVTSLARLLVEMLLETPNSTILSPLSLLFTVNLCLLVYPAQTQSRDWMLGPHYAKLQPGVGWWWGA